MARLKRLSGTPKPPRPAGRPAGLPGRSRRTLLASTALHSAVGLILAGPVAAQPAPNAQPVFQNLAGGAASVRQTPSATTVVQTSDRAALNWRAFDVGSRQTVIFQQPDAAAVALNTVTGPDPSRIAGKIAANGQIVLVNQSGVLFYRGSQVNTAGLAVSTAGANAAQFMAGGKIVLDRPGAPNAKIVNNGHITIQGAGLASLVAPSVANAGTIDAKLGHVVLAGASTATLDLYGDKLISVALTGAVTRAPDEAGALVTNTGTIQADGGTVRLTARAVDGLVTNLVSAGGTIRANSQGNRTGRISIGGVGGSIVIDGAVSADGPAASSKGGRIQLLASGAVTVGSGASVSASGMAGGGTIAVGTTLKRAAGGPGAAGAGAGAKTAKSVTIAQGATLAANAGAVGSGGTVVVLAIGATAMAGLIQARGGPDGGGGGAIEVSGAAVGLSGLTDAGAPRGKTGSLLLDPDDLYISDIRPAVAAAADTSVPAGTDRLLAGPAASWISPAMLAAQNADIAASASNNLFVAASAGTANTLNIGSHNLTLTAGAHLTVDRGVTIAANSLAFAAGGSIALNTQAGVSAGLISAGRLAVLGVTAMNAAGITLAAGTGIRLSSAAIGASGPALERLDLTVTGSGGVTQDAGGTVKTGLLTSGGGIPGGLAIPSGVTISSGVATPGGAITPSGTASPGSPAISGGVSLPGNGNEIGTIASLSTSVLTIFDTRPLVLAGAVNAGIVDLSAPSLFQAAGATLTAGRLTSRAGFAGDVALNGTANAVGTVSGLIAGSFTLVGTVPLTLAGTVAAATVDLTAPSVTQDASATLFTSLLTSGGGIPGQATFSGTANAIGTIAGLSTGGLRAAGQFPLVLAGTIDAGAGGTVDLTAPGVTQDRDAVLSAGLLTSTGGIGGPLVLSGTANAIGTIGGLTAAGLTLVNSRPLALSGQVSAGASGTADITAPGLSQDSGGTLIAGVLTSTGGIGATPRGIEDSAVPRNEIRAGAADGVSLLGRANAIGTISGLTAAGPLIVFDRAPVLTIAGAAGSSGGNVYLNNGTGQVRFAAGAVLSAVPGGTAGIVADSLANLGTAAVGRGMVDAGTAGVLELAPATARGFVLGSPLDTPGALALPGNTGIAAGTLRIGAVTPPEGGGPVVTAGSIVVAGAFPAGIQGMALDLQSNGGIVQAAAAPLKGFGTVTASTNGAIGDILLGAAANTIAALSNIGVANGDFVFATTPASGIFAIRPGQTIFANNVSMTVTGTLAVTGGILAAGALSLTAQGPSADLIVGAGALIGGRATASLAAGRDILQTGGFVNGGSVSLSALRTLTQSGGTAAALGRGLSVSSVTLTQTGTASSFWSNGTLSVAAPGGVSLTGANIAAGGVSIETASGTLAVTAGTLASGGDLRIAGGGFAQTGGTIAAAGTLSLSVSGLATQTGGSAGADVVSMTVAAGGSAGGAFGVRPTFGAAPAAATASAVAGIGRGITVLPAEVTPPRLGIAAARPYRINVTSGPDYAIPPAGLSANWIAFDVAGALTGGPLTANLVTGRALSATLTDAANAIDRMGAFTATSGLTLSSTSALSVVDLVQVNQNQGTVSVRTGALTIDHAGTVLVVPSVAGAPVHADSLVTAGSLAVTAASAGTLANGSLTGAAVTSAAAGDTSSRANGAIVLRTDTLTTITGGAAGGTLIRIPDGLVAIAPDTMGRAISLGGTEGLSLTRAILTTIDTAGTGDGAAGRQTLMLGSVDGSTARAGAIGVSAGLDLRGVARTLALFATGDIAETGAGALSIATLTAVSLTGNLYLGGPNAVASLGGAAAAGLNAPNGNVLFRGTIDLTVPATSQITGARAAGAFAEIDGAANLTVAGKVTGGSVFLRAGGATSAGHLTVAASGLVTAIAGGETDLAAGVAYTAATASTGPSTVHTIGANGQGNVTVAGTVTAGTAAAGVPASTTSAATGGWGTGTIGLFAAADINETGMLGAGTLRGIAGGTAALTGIAALSGGGANTANRIASLGSFTAGTGFFLRDGQALSVDGPLTAMGGGIALAVSDTRNGGVGIADIALAGPVTAAAGTVTLTATGHVYEAAGGTVSAGTLTVSAGTDSDSGLMASAGPAEIAFFGNLNQVGTFAAAAPGGVLFVNGGDLFVAGSVVAGTSADPPTIRSLSAVPGPFGTTPDHTSVLVPGGAPLAGGGAASGFTTLTIGPFLELDTIRSGTAASGNLTLGAASVLHAGREGTVTGGIVLRAGGSAAGAVTQQAGGGVFAANDGLVDISAGFDPGIAPATPAYAAACGVSGCGIVVNGTIWGDRTGVSPAPAALVVLNAGSSIDQTDAAAAIGARTLSGRSGGHTNLSGLTPSEGTFPAAGGPAANRIAAIGTFAVNTVQDDRLGFYLRDGMALSVNGGIADGGASVSRGIRIAVNPADAAAIGNADLILAGRVSAAATVDLQARGDIAETAGGMISAATLIAQAGLIPESEPSGHRPGAALTDALAPAGSVSLRNANRVQVLAASSAAGDLGLTDGTSLTVMGPVTAGGTFQIAGAGGLTIGSGVSVTAGAARFEIAGAAAVAGRVSVADALTIAAGTSVSLPGMLTSGAGTIAVTSSGTLTLTEATRLSAGVAIRLTDPGTIQLGGTLTAPSIVVAAGAGTVTARADTTIQTGGTARPSGAVALEALPTAAAANGFYLVAGSFSQTGSLIVTGAASIVRFDSLSKILFDRDQGLVAPDSWAILAVTGSPAGGPADSVVLRGHIATANLDVAVGAGGGSAALTGTVAGLSGAAAAAAAGIVPSGNARFRLNGCAIASVTCVVVQVTQADAKPPPLRYFALGSIASPSDEADLLLPLVSDRIY